MREPRRVREWEQMKNRKNEWVRETEKERKKKARDGERESKKKNQRKKETYWNGTALVKGFWKWVRTVYVCVWGGGCS